MRSCLIVDDSATARLLLANAVRAAKKGVVDFHEAEDHDAAMRLFRETAPDVVFLDMMLGGDDPRSDDTGQAGGVKLLRELLAERPHTHVVIVTGLGPNQPDVVDAVSLGAVAVLRKPLKPEEVRYVLDAIEPEKGRMDYFG